MTVHDQDLVAEWAQRFSEPTAGWSFASFEGKVGSGNPPWSYTDLARRFLPTARSVLDLGTGGGEQFLAFADVLPSDTHATEGWDPNVAIARAALAPHGIDVVAHNAERGEQLPYPAARFDVVMPRHAAYEVTDVARVLRPGGVFLTQQVDGRNLADLSAVFGADPAYPDTTLAVCQELAADAGLVVEEAREWNGKIRFADVATLVSYLRMMPWQLPADFTVERYASALLGLQQRAAPLTFTEVRFLLIARRR
ncbi:class I SAM-dependent methyltransferase [Kineococcus sp. NPDC059986]|uniref:class I SAM-dependent methyltransferase n=1 Tax=Kineococcus sp. NPDC059986 TaxID=3155538 RepID=UPI00344C1E8C